jgi:glycine/serine hydroxymethyltransferase
MEEKEHEPIIQLDGIIKCRKCGKFLQSMTEEIANPDSGVKANRIMHTIASAGQFKAIASDNEFAAYTREVNGNIEELRAEMISPRKYRVYRKITHVGGDD